MYFIRKKFLRRQKSEMYWINLYCIPTLWKFFANQKSINKKWAGYLFHEINFREFFSATTVILKQFSYLRVCVFLSKNIFRKLFGVNYPELWTCVDKKLKKEKNEEIYRQCFFSHIHVEAPRLTFIRFIIDKSIV
jgi:hypothetical protein